MATIEQRTRLARLMVASPEAVYEELRVYAAEVDRSPFQSSSKELEEALLGRNDPLIDLGLASFCSSTEVARKLYSKGKALGDEVQGKGLRMAVLSNETLNRRSVLGRFPQRTIGDEEVRYVLKEAEWSEAEALVRNPTVSDDVLRALYRGNSFAKGIDEARRRELVMFTGYNERLVRREDGYDGPDMGHYYIHQDIFEMLNEVPTSKSWASSVRWLLDRLDPAQTASPDDIGPVLERWKLDESGESDEPQKEHYTDTGLSEREELRCLIGALFGKSYGKREVTVLGSPEDEDVARRCAYYGNAALTEESLREGFERDENVFVFAALLNDGIFRTTKLRRLFEEECLTGSWTRRYERRLAQIKKNWPYFDTRPMAEWMVEQPKPDAVDPLRQHLEALQEDTKKLIRIVSILPWAIAAVAVLALWR